MTDEEAAWIRANVWTQAMRKTYADVPGEYAACACQYGLTTWCQRGDCGRCHRATPLPGPAGYLCDRGEHPLVFAEPYEHPTPSATGHHETSLAMFWLADRVCRWLCPCDCHSSSPRPATRPRPAARVAPSDDGALFDLAVSA